MSRSVSLLLAMTVTYHLASQHMAIEAAANDATAEGVKTLCDEEAYADGLAKYLEAGLTQKERDAEQLQKQKNLWYALSAALPDAKNRCLYLALAMKAEQATEQAYSTISEIKDHQLKTIRLLARHAGHLQTTRTVANSKLAERPGAHATTSTTTVHLALKLEAASVNTCKERPTAAEITEVPATPQYNKLLKLKITKPEDVHKSVLALTATLGALVSCARNGAANNAITNLMESCVAGTSLTISGTAKEPPTHQYSTQATPIFMDNQHLGKCDETVTEPEKENDYAKRLAYYICKALKNERRTLPSIADYSGTTLKGDGMVLNVLRNCLPEYSGIQKSQDPKENDALAKFIEKEYTDKAATFTTQYVTNLKNNKLQARNDKETKPMSVTDTTDAEKLSEVISYAEGERNKKELEAEKKDAATSKPIDSKKEEKCKGKQQSECKEDKDCEYKDGKCKHKEGVKSENDEKNTNTTGNNSFPVKAPLLLAVLLLA
ncbi:uncharacterized protein TEOVI_000562600 [Trypanosoma equiperdum]|uniref:Variant surface glycoprotein (VSG) n=1 Tax=Trypanosoma equiperdum TaxID=5694 RepID=A0A1G4I3S6_TRYEQ|nr:hypothetical protein TEOVI_000562600 [Trypanosoma equiperdum]